MQYINILWFLIIPVINFYLGKMKIQFLHYTSKDNKETQGPCLPSSMHPQIQTLASYYPTVLPLNI